MATAQRPYLDEASARKAIAATAREIYERKLSGAMDGNLSVRIGVDRVVTTPSGVHKGRLQPDDLVLCDLAGHALGRGTRHDRKPSSEIGLHVAAYARRPDVGAVIHAHPPMAIAYQLAGGRLSEVLVSEVVFACGRIATAPYTTPTTQQVPEVLGDYLGCYDVVLMARHGSVTVGPDLDTALARLDALEHTALIYCTARMLGGAVPIADPEVDHLLSLARPEPPPWRRAGNTCPAPEQPEKKMESADEARLVAAVLDRLRGRGSG
jgi:L-fuculose-phosphate aldolase